MTESISQLLAIARSGLVAQQMGVDIVSNNLANVNTTGFKSNRLNFQELLANASLGGTEGQSSQLLTQAGALKQTGQPLDLAVQGDGFLPVKLPNGQTGYTRDGQLQVDATNQLVTAEGFPVVWQGQIPASHQALHVNPDGTVMAEQNNVWSQVGQLSLSRFANSAALVDGGQNALIVSAASGPAITGTPGSTGFGQLASGVLEASNVDMGREMTELTLLQRGYSMSLQAFQQTDQMLSLAIQLRQ
jgi:flagellar basal-body rod protein FlgG